MVFEQGGFESGLKHGIIVGSKVAVQETDGSQSFDWVVIKINPGNGNLHVRREMPGGEEEKWVNPGKVQLAPLADANPVRLADSPEISDVRRTLRISPEKRIILAHTVFGSGLMGVAVPRDGSATATELWTLSYVVLDSHGHITSIVVTSPLNDGIKLFDKADFLKHNKSWTQRITAYGVGS